ncbi:MAG: exodeoxyribonuclease III [Saprospiraceae bacterium]|nr:exodeoxyribonuclease III [Saprospiraceae bacterium]MBK8450479.1 exodeoxyribonuclease III [Saprospiraceae bacterium]MBK9222664.1 exodeoxyribonuclease III [Saprospiraceae bacterium]MBK9720291.1 exodeoxyribonuclease III [Saprospiraceae bacterium]MBK9727286.1 exodeoxyribonuclease III [Saprospiraceae bacterium]
MKRIVSFNVNGLRAAISKGFNEWVASQAFDIICLQETKMDNSHANPDYFKELGYESYWHCAEKKGYSGVLILSKEKPKNISYGTGIEAYDREGRLIVLDYDGFSIANCYFPSGSSGEDRHSFKMQFLSDMYPKFKKLEQEKKNLIIVGDYNIVHQDIDIHNPERKDNPSGFRPEERAWLDAWFHELFLDSFRVLYPEKQAFSWWSYRAGSYGKDKGWRIDYQSISKSLKSKVKDFKHHRDIRFSDHCPLEGIYEL